MLRYVLAAQKGRGAGVGVRSRPQFYGTCWQLRRGAGVGAGVGVRFRLGVRGRG